MTSLHNDDPLTFYLREVSKVRPLTKDEEADLLRQFRTQRKPEAEFAAKLLIEANLPLVVSIAERHAAPGVDMVNLIERGNESLLFALKTFGESSSDSLSTHAATCIERAVAKAIAESAKN
jgi:RNA polymerase primary sigma factor